MESSENLGLPYIMPSQAQKHVTHNEAIRLLDALVQLRVADSALTAPPAEPEPGARYLLPSGCTGAWAGHDGRIAAWQDGGWLFVDPRPGFLAWNAAASELSVFDGAGWAAVPSGSSPAPALPLLGLNATADPARRLAVASDTALLTHDGDDHRLLVNKAGAGDTASIVFQNGHSGRAEIGLAGDDRLRFKVSEDGAAFSTAMVIDGRSGAASFPATPCGMVNLLVNGDFAVNQRLFAGGALAAGTCGHDRWKAGTGGASYTVSGGTVSHASGPLAQVIESPGLAGATVTVSVEDLGGGDLQVDVAGATGTIAAGAGRRGVTLAVPSGSTGNVTVTLTPASGAVSYRRVQLNEGAEPLAFERRHSATELALCQRYFEKTYNMAAAPGSANAVSGRLFVTCAVSGGSGDLRTGAAAFWPFKAEKRIAPSITIYSTVTGAAGMGRNHLAGIDDVAQVLANSTHSTAIRPANSVAAGQLWTYHATAEAEL